MWNLFKVNNKDTRTTSMTSFWFLYCWLWIDFTRSSGVSIVNFEQVNKSWDGDISPECIDYHTNSVNEKVQSYSSSKNKKLEKQKLANLRISHTFWINNDQGLFHFMRDRSWGNCCRLGRYLICDSAFWFLLNKRNYIEKNKENFPWLIGIPNTNG